MAEEKNERRIKVLTRQNIYVAGSAGKPVKVKKGMLVLLGEDEIDNFEGAVTRDIPKVKKGEEALVEFKRGG